MKKRLDRNCIRMLWAVLNKSPKQHPTKQHLYGHLPPISKTIPIRHVGYCCRSKNKLISDILLWTPLHGHASVSQPTRTYLQQICTDTGCSQEDLLKVMNDERERERERERESRKSMLAAWYDDDIEFLSGMYFYALVDFLNLQYTHDWQTDITVIYICIYIQSVSNDNECGLFV